MPSSESGSDGEVALRERFEELREDTKGHWNTQAEATLLATLGLLHARLMTRSAQTRQNVEDLYVRTTAAHVTLTNTFNSLQLLSQQQFVQHRIATEDLQLRRERLKQTEEESYSDEGDEQEECVSSASSHTRLSDYHQRAKKRVIVRRMYAYVEACKEALAEEGVRVPLCPADVEELAEENPYQHRRLCALIGTDAFLRDAAIGCAGERDEEANGKAPPVISSPSAPPTNFAGSAASSPKAFLPVASKTTAPAAPSQDLHKGAVPSAVAATPAQAVSRPSALVVPPPVKSVVPPPKPAVPPPAKATAAQRVAAKKQQLQALFSSSSSSASSSTSPGTPLSATPARASRKAAAGQKVKPKRAPPKTTGRNLFGSSSSSESEVETSSTSDSSTLSSSTSEDVLSVVEEPKPESKAAAFSRASPPPAVKRPFVPSPVHSSRSSSASTKQATRSSPPSPPPPPLLPPPPPLASVSSAAQDSTTAAPDETKTTTASSATAAQSSALTSSVQPQSVASSALPLPPLVFSLDDEAVLTTAARAPPAAVPPAPPAPVSSAGTRAVPARGGKLLSTSSDEDE